VKGCRPAAICAAIWPVRWTGLLLMVVLALVGAPASAYAQDPQPVQDTEQLSSAADSRADDEDTAVAVVDEFWRRHFADEGLPYRSPRVVGGYDGSAGPRCGDERVVADNALYCTAGDYVAWDDDLMASGYEQIGDGWVYVVIAHEWAHAVQVRLDRAGASTATELQADCLAGAALQGAADEGLVRLEAGDDEELVRSLTVAADDGSGGGISHGTASQRTSAFRTGVEGGVAACL
jgi:uncharacterized protein